MDVVTLPPPLALVYESKMNVILFLKKSILVCPSASYLISGGNTATRTQKHIFR